MNSRQRRGARLACALHCGVAMLMARASMASAAVILAFAFLIGSIGCSSSAGTDAPPPAGDVDAGAHPGGPSKDAGAHADSSTPGDDSGGGDDDDASTPDDATPPPPPATTRVVGYLPNYSGSYSDWANRIDFTKMTHMNLAFAKADGNDGWNMGASDGEVKALVDKAHAAGTKVLASLGGGGGDQSVIARYKDPSHIPALVDNLDAFLTRLNLDGADVDIEDPGQLGQNYSKLIDAIVAKLRPQGKLVTAAVAQYLQDNMADTTLRQFDFINVMVYSNYQDGVDAMTFYTHDKGLDPKTVVLGAGFFGTDDQGNETGYRDILQADGSAWSKDTTNVNGKTVHYTGMATMKKIADYSKGFGGIMFWELSLDTNDEHSLYKVIQGEM